MKCGQAFQLEGTVEMNATNCNVHPESVFVVDQACRRGLRFTDSSQVVVNKKEAGKSVLRDITVSSQL